MMAGAGIQPGMIVEPPYDSLSFVPTMLSLVGRGDPASYPGPVIESIATRRQPVELHSTSIPEGAKTP